MLKPLLLSLSISLQLGYLIALPMIGGALLGKYIDNKYQTNPTFLIVFIVLATILSGYLVIKRLKKIQAEMEKKWKK